MAPMERGPLLIQLIQYPAQMIALLASGLFAGAMVYSNAIEQPRRLRSGDADALDSFQNEIRRSEGMLVGLAALSAAAAVLAGATGSGMPWLAGGLVNGLAAVYLVTEVRRTRAALDGLPSDLAAPELLRRWAGHKSSLTVTGLCVYFVFLLQI
jgi:hypothetical protein